MYTSSPFFSTTYTENASAQETYTDNYYDLQGSKDVTKLFDRRMSNNSCKKNNNTSTRIRTTNDYSMSSLSLSQEATYDETNTILDVPTLQKSITASDTSTYSSNLTQNKMKILSINGNGKTNMNILNSAMEKLVAVKTYLSIFGSQLTGSTDKSPAKSTTLQPSPSLLTSACSMNNRVAEFSSCVISGFLENYLIHAHGENNNLLFANSSLKHTKPEGSEICVCINLEDDGQHDADINCCAVSSLNSHHPLVYIGKNSEAQLSHTKLKSHSNVLIDGIGTLKSDPVSSETVPVISQSLNLQSN